MKDYLCILHAASRRSKAGLQSLLLAKSAVIPVFPDRIVYHHLAPVAESTPSWLVKRDRVQTELLELGGSFSATVDLAIASCRRARLLSGLEYNRNRDSHHSFGEPGMIRNWNWPKE